MNRYMYLIFGVAFFCLATAYASSNSLSPETFVPPEGAFDIPDTAPETVITANRLSLKDGIALLEGAVNVKRENETLTCGKAIVSNEPRWMLASITPRVYRKDNIDERKVIQELNLEAKNIFASDSEGKLNASSSVYVRLEERSWDLASFTWAVITSDDLLAFRESERVIFSGNVKFRDEESYGEGNRLDYAQKLGLVILSGNAFMEVKEINPDTGKKEPRILKGNVITYNTTTREAVSE